MPRAAVKLRGDVRDTDYECRAGLFRRAYQELMHLSAPTA